MKALLLPLIVLGGSFGCASHDADLSKSSPPEELISTRGGQDANPARSDVYGNWLRILPKDSKQLGLSFRPDRVIEFREGEQDPLVENVESLTTAKGSLGPVLDQVYRIEESKLVFVYRDDPGDSGLKCIIGFRLKGKNTLELVQLEGDRGVPIGTYKRLSP